MRHQHTLERAVTVHGTGLHTGNAVTVELLPAEAGTGLIFQSRDHPDAAPIPARYTSVLDTRLATTLGNADWRVSTVEHLLAALWVSELSNVIIAVSGGEIPVLDGSAAPWMEALSGGGRVRQRAPRPVLSIGKPLEVRDGARWARLSPGPELWLSAQIAFEHPRIRHQSLSLSLNEESFRSELSWARTFGFLSDVEALHAAGLALGGGLENAVIYDAEDVLNPEGLRGSDEAVRHKLLDMVGDLALAGVDIQGRFEASRPGHALNHLLLQRLFDSPGHWVMLGEKG